MIVPPFIGSWPTLTCGQIVYRLTYADSTALNPLLFTFSSSTLTLTIESSSNLLVGIYYMLLSASYIEAPYNTEYVTFLVTILKG